MTAFSQGPKKFGEIELASMEAPANFGEIFVGAAIEEWSERRTIEQVHVRLTAAGVQFIILANFQIAARQVDCVLVTERRVAVLEIKTSRIPVRGGLDGDWERLDSTGRWHRYTNGYQQALGIKNRLRDAMRGRGDVTSFYPDAAVIFATPLPDGSALTVGDFKVVVTDLAGFDPTEAGNLSNPWPLDIWRDFAMDRSLRAASLAEVLAGPTLESAFALVRDYRDRIIPELQRDGDRWLFENDEQRDALVQSLEFAPGCYISGPSGCGKTLAARWLASRLSRSGECVIFLAAKDFDGSWARLLERELALVIDASPRVLFHAIRATGCPLRIVLDGINELGAAQDIALRGLRAIARRLDAWVIVTGQAAQTDQIASLVPIAIAPPSLALKERIAATGLPATSASIRALLKAVTSGFEAAIVAEIGADVRPEASRQLLVDQFIRKRLGGRQRGASRGLRRFAKGLIETTSFSMSETVFDELMASSDLGSIDIDACFDAAILIRRGGRVSFTHEILLNGCAAFSFAQHAAEAGEKFAVLLALPALVPIAADIVSVIDDAAVVTTILGSTKDHALLYEAARGLAGPIARGIVDELFGQTEAAIEAEIRGLRLAIVAGDSPSVDWEEGTLHEWSDVELARIAALARGIGSGHRIERYFDLCAAMDAALLVEHRRLYDAALSVGIKALRSYAFRLAYSGFGRESGLCMISGKLASGMFDIIDLPGRSASYEMATLTSGQLYFYLERRRLFLDDVDVDVAASELTRVVIERFRWEPQLVKLAILQAAPFMRLASPDKLAALVEAIEAIDADKEGIWISTEIIDALKYLGALEDSAEGAREGIAAEFERATGPEDSEYIRDLALRTSTAMFDHPYDGIYSEEFDALTLDQRCLLIRRAASAEDARKSVFLGWIIREIASFGDRGDIAIMQEFARLPDSRNSFPQEEWGAFTVATRFLGRHGLDLPPLDGASNVERALIQLQYLLYVTESGNAPGPAERIWNELDGLPVVAVMGCLCEIEDALREQHWNERQGAPRPSLLRPYASKWLELARRFLDSGEEAQHFHRAYGRDRAPDLAFGIIELFGDRSDLARLRRLANESRFARQALDGLRKLDSA